MALQKSPSGKPKPMGTGLLGHPVNLPKHGQVGQCKIQAVVRDKRIRCIHLKVIMIKSDTYHDTWTNYLMEQEPSPIQDQADGDGCCCC
jgi:hypothetical protein